MTIKVNNKVPIQAEFEIDVEDERYYVIAFLGNNMIEINEIIDANGGKHPETLGREHWEEITSAIEKYERENN